MTRGEEELRRIRGLDARIKARIKEMAQMREQVTSIQASSLSEKVSGSKCHDLSDVVAVFLDQTHEIRRKIVLDMQERQEIVTKILNMENPLYAAILYWHFAAGMSHEEKAGQIDCSESKVKHNYRPAVAAYEKEYFHDIIT